MRKKKLKNNSNNNNLNADNAPNTKYNDESIEVKLKPILGMQPGVYLTIIYFLAAIILLYAVLFHHGINNPGAKVIFQTYPEEVAVYKNGKYLGSTPFSIYIENGPASFTFKKAYHRTKHMEINIPARIIGSRFLPKKITIDQRILLEDVDNYMEWRFNDIVSWAFVDRYHDRYHWPLLITATIKDLAASDIPRDIIFDFLYASLHTLRYSYQAEDFIDSVIYISNQEGLELSSSIDEIINYLQKNIQYDVNYEAVTVLIAALIGELHIDSTYQLENIDNDFLVQKIKAAKATLEELEAESSAFPLSRNEYLNTITNDDKDDTITFSDFVFYYVPSTQFKGGRRSTDPFFFIENSERFKEYPHLISVKGFYIMDRPITKKHFTSFLNDHPEWSLDNLEYLIENEYVSKDYLANFNELNDSTPITYISWYAAKAFTQWMQNNIPQALHDYTVRLPTESEYELSALYNMEVNSSITAFGYRNREKPLDYDIERAGLIGAVDLIGNVWEWCENWYFPLSGVIDGYESIANRKGIEKGVRGGSWVNREEDIHTWTRGSQPPEWTTPFIGFRPVLIKK